MQLVIPHGHADPFSGQTSPKVRIPPILPMIMCYCSPYLLVIRISDFNNAEISRGHLLRPLLCTRLALTDMSTQFPGQTSPEANIPSVLPMIVCYSSPSLLVIRPKNLKKNLTNPMITLPIVIFFYLVWFGFRNLKTDLNWFGFDFN